MRRYWPTDVPSGNAQGEIFSWYYDQVLRTEREMHGHDVPTWGQPVNWATLAGLQEVLHGP